MKTIQLFLISIVLILSSCITIETTSSGFKDEIYYSAEQYAKQVNKILEGY